MVVGAGYLANMTGVANIRWFGSFGDGVALFFGSGNGNQSYCCLWFYLFINISKDTLRVDGLTATSTRPGGCTLTSIYTGEGNDIITVIPNEVHGVQLVIFSQV